MDILISVILPTYNRAEMLGMAIDSVLAQDYKNWELLIVDDGSTDQTETVVAEKQKKDSRIVYHKVENGERSRARNIGISLAKGDYVCFLDSDDRFLKDNLTNWVSYIKEHKNPLALMYSDYIIEKEGKEFERNVKFESAYSANFLFENPLVPPQVCVAKKILDEYHFIEKYNVGEDVTLWLRVNKRYPIMKSEHLSFRYATHEGNTINPNSNSSLVMIENFREFFEENPEIRAKMEDKRYLKYWSEMYTNAGKYHFRKKQKWLAFKMLVRAIFTAPFHEQTKYRVNILRALLFSKSSIPPQ